MILDLLLLNLPTEQALQFIFCIAFYVFFSVRKPTLWLGNSLKAPLTYIFTKGKNLPSKLIKFLELN